MPTYTEGGPGRKKCDCGIFVPARTSTCPKCGHVFVSRISEERARVVPRAPVPVAAAVEPERSTDSREVLVVGNGPCPVLLEQIDEESVVSWARALEAALPTFRVSRSAARNWLRTLFAPHTSEYRQVCAQIYRSKLLCEP